MPPAPAAPDPERASVAPQAPLHDDTYDILGAVVTCFGAGETCAGESQCLNNACYVPKSRCVSVRPNPANAGLTARRVSLDLGVAGSVVLGWAQEPVVYHPSIGPQPVLVSDIADTPVYRDWNADPVDTQGNIVVHISGCEVSNGHVYLIQSIDADEDEQIEANYSAALSLPTTMLFGDSGGPGSGPPDGVANFADISLEVLAFMARPIVPPTWMRIIATNGPFDPTIVTLAGDVLQAVLAFQGQPYPGLAPLDCP